MKASVFLGKRMRFKSEKGICIFCVSLLRLHFPLEAKKKLFLPSCFFPLASMFFRVQLRPCMYRLHWFEKASSFSTRSDLFLMDAA